MTRSEANKLFLSAGNDLGKCESGRGKVDRGRFCIQSEVSNQAWNRTKKEANKKMSFGKDCDFTCG